MNPETAIGKQTSMQIRRLATRTRRRPITETTQAFERAGRRAKHEKRLEINHRQGWYKRLCVLCAGRRIHRKKCFATWTGRVRLR